MWISQHAVGVWSSTVCVVCQGLPLWSVVVTTTTEIWLYLINPLPSALLRHHPVFCLFCFHWFDWFVIHSSHTGVQGFKYLRESPVSHRLKDTLQCIVGMLISYCFGYVLIVTVISQGCFFSHCSKHNVSVFERRTKKRNFKTSDLRFSLFSETQLIYEFKKLKWVISCLYKMVEYGAFTDDLSKCCVCVCFRCWELSQLCPSRCLKSAPCTGWQDKQPLCYLR